MTRKKVLLILAPLVLGGCLSASSESLDASSDANSSGQSRDRDGKEGGKPRQVCETTSIAGEPKSFCY